jgi:UDP-GlcNAc3NAcA epimerase
MKLLTIIGARPQFIKAATVSRIIQQRADISEILVHTGQHYDNNMSEIFFQQLDIPQPDYHLGIGSGSHGSQTGKMLETIESVLLKEKPDWVLVYGDTNSTLAGALAAVKLHIPVAHVEAGLRSFNRKMPEEINRVLTDHAADLLFPPTQAAVDNLDNEGIDKNKIDLVGDVMYDAALYYSAKAKQQSKVLEQLQLTEKNYILATIHRAENTDNPARLKAIFDGLEQIAEQIPVILPLHPRTNEALKHHKQPTKNIQLIEPVGYLDMVMLEKQAKLIATDSGGVQKEAYFHQVPCVTLRNDTEWLELLELGANVLSSPTEIVEVVLSNLEKVVDGDVGLYGDGEAALGVVNQIGNL